MKPSYPVAGRMALFRSFVAMSLYHFRRNGVGLAERAQRPGKDQNGRRDAERDHVGERIVLNAELRLGTRQARHSAIEAVEQPGDQDGNAGGHGLIANGRYHGVEARHQRSRGQGIGQQEGATGRDLFGSILVTHRQIRGRFGGVKNIIPPCTCARTPTAAKSGLPRSGVLT